MGYQKHSAIYKITSPSGKVYVGQTISFPKRMSAYKNGYAKGQPRLHNSLSKYGWSSHVVEILQECAVSELSKQEVYWGTKFDVLGLNGLNCKIGEKSNTVQRPEIGLAISASKKGMVFSEEHKKKLSIAHTGKKITKEHHDKLLKAATEAKYKAVICINTGETFKSVKDAAEHFNTKFNNISNVLQGWSKSTCGGLKFKFITN